MSTIIDKSLILSELKSAYRFRSDAEFARFLDIKPQTLASWYKRNTFDVDLLYAKCGEVAADFLLTGKGNVLKTQKQVNIEDELSGAKLNENLADNLRAENNAILINDDTVDDNQVEVITNIKGNKFYLLPNGRIKLEVVKVPFSSYVSYLDVYQDDIKLGDDFEKITFTVDFVGRGYYVGFKTVGDSMNGGNIDDTPDGAEVLAREIGSHLWANGFDKTRYGMILITNAGIYHKDIVNYCKETGMLELASRNPKFQTMEFPINEVKQIFNVVKRTF